MKVNLKIDVTKLPEGLRGVTEEAAGELGLAVGQGGCELTAAEGKELRVSYDGSKLQIVYPALNQYFRGLRLIKQHYDKRGFTIAEKCSTSELGIMLDCSRNAVRTVEHVKLIIRQLALMGYNQLQLYTEDTYEVEGEPYFGYMRGRYTKAEMKEIDDYAYKFGIEVVPCVQTLAHLNQIFRWQPYAAINDIDDILMIDDDRTYELISHMLATLSECFRSRKIHIGMDEAQHIGRGLYEDRFGAVKNRTALIMKHLKKVIKMCEKYGYKPMMWSDMFFRIAFDGKYYTATGKIDDKVLSSIPKNIRLVYWDYYSYDRKLVENMIANHVAFKCEVMYGGGAWMWSGFAPANNHSFKVTDLALDICKQYGVDKVLMTMWGDDGAECSDQAVLPTLVMTAEKAYGHSDFDKAFDALTDVDLGVFMRIEAVNDVKKSEEPENRHRFRSNPCKYMLYNDPMIGLMDGLIEEGESAIYEQHIKDLKAAEKVAGKFEYLFTTQRTLAEVMLLKYELGVKTRAAYKAGDVKAIKDLVRNAYEPLVKKLEAFYDAFEHQWAIENKPYGFEVQDYRIGGLIKRIEHCAARLNAYVAGETKVLPELDETILDISGSGAPTKRRLNYNGFARIISAGRI